jgi:hypothetical protein
VLHQAGVDTNSSCHTFVQCLQLVEDWSDAHPGHVAIGILLDMKDAQVDEPKFQRLEREILSVFERARLITPDDVRGTSSTLGGAVRERGWPTLGATRGDVYFMLYSERIRQAYLEGHPSLEGRLAFTQSVPGAPDAAFTSIDDPVAGNQAITAAVAAKMMVRTRPDADTKEARTGDTRRRDVAFGSGAQILSTDYERPDPSLATGYFVAIPEGTPARCNPVTAPPECRPEDVEDPALLGRQ